MPDFFGWFRKPSAPAPVTAEAARADVAPMLMDLRGRVIEDCPVCGGEGRTAMRFRVDRYHVARYVTPCFLCPRDPRPGRLGFGTGRIAVVEDAA